MKNLFSKVVFINIFKKIILFFLLMSSHLVVAASFSVQYKPLAKTISSDKIEGEIKVTNTGTQSENLSALSVQYYFIKEGAANMVGISDYAAVLGTNYRVITSNVALAFDSSKINITFGANSGTLLPNQTLHFKFRANASNWFLQNQSNDSSFNGNINDFTAVTNITVNNGVITPVDLTGIVKDTNGKIIPNAKIKYPGGELISLSNGSFSGSANIGGATTIIISAPGYVDYAKVYTPAVGKIAIFARLLRVDTTKTIYTNVQNVIVASGGASVTFPPMLDITEPLSVSVTHIRASSNDIRSAPGDFSGVSVNGSQVQLASQGMLDVVVRGVNSQQIYSLANKGPFKITIPASVPSTAPSTISMWYYNTAAGKWFEEGYATLANGVYTGNVNHFTAWNMDVPNCGGTSGVCACILGKVEDPSNIKFANTSNLYTIVAEGSGWSKTIDATAAQISSGFQLKFLPPGATKVTVFNQTTNWVGSLSNDVRSPPGCTSFPIIPLGSVELYFALVGKCNGEPVNGAKAELFNASGQLVKSMTSSFSSFDFYNLEPNTAYSVTVTHPQYDKTTKTDLISRDGHNIYTFIELDDLLTAPSTKTVTGKVIDATTASLAAGVKVEIWKGDPNVGPLVFSGTTNANGEYTATLERGGYYTYVVTNLQNQVFTRIEYADCELTPPDIIMMPPPLPPSLYILMSWRTGKPDDLDSYLSGPGFRVNFQNRIAGSKASLNVDARGNSSTEIIALNEETLNSNYTYSVHDYSNRSSLNSTSLSNSGAKVTVIRNGAVINEFTAPLATGTLWRVFSMVNGVITPINTMSNATTTDGI